MKNKTEFLQEANKILQVLVIIGNTGLIIVDIMSHNYSLALVHFNVVLAWVIIWMMTDHIILLQHSANTAWEENEKNWNLYSDAIDKLIKLQKKIKKVGDKKK